MYYRAARLFSSRKPARDLSRGGVRVLTDHAFALGVRLEIELFLPDGRSVQVTVRVSWLAPIDPPSEAAFEAGLEFMELSPERAALLEECLRVHHEQGCEPP